MSKRRPKQVIRADDAIGRKLESAAVECEIQLAESGDGETPPAIEILAYTGQSMQVAGFAERVVIDLAGMKAPTKARPILFNHDRSQVLGHTERVDISASEVRVRACLSGANARVSEIVESARNKLPWQASVGAPVERLERVASGKEVTVNGRRFVGPLLIAREARLAEVSIVALGADDDTTSRIAAQRQGDHAMTFEQWLKAQGIDANSLTEEGRKNLEASWKRDQGQGEPSDPPGGGGGGDVDPEDVSKTISDVRRTVAAEQRRVAEIQSICKDAPEIAADAIEQGWSRDKTELELMRRNAPNVVGHTAGTANNSPGTKKDQAQSLECALAASCGVQGETLTKLYGDQVVEAANRDFEGVGLRDAVVIATRNIDGADVPAHFGDGDKHIQAAFSSVTVPKIIENVINKQALEAYQAAPIQAFQIAKVSRTSDFKKVSRVRMLGTGRYEKVEAGGQLESGKVAEQAYENQLDTYGQVIFIDRQTIINDDLGVLSDAGREVGNQGAEIINTVTAEALLGAVAGGSFFSSANGNIRTGVNSKFGDDSLNRANTDFLKQKAGPGSKQKDQRPINIPPEVLLVPPEELTNAQILIGSSEMGIAGDTDRREGRFNPWRGRYRIVMMPHLSDVNFAGASSTAYYLLANPTRLPALELLFLNGVQRPRVERVNPPANQLGVGFRGFIDVGASTMDPRGIHLSTGEAA